MGIDAVTTGFPANRIPVTAPQTSNQFRMAPTTVPTCDRTDERPARLAGWYVQGPGGAVVVQAARAAVRRAEGADRRPIAVFGRRRKRG